MKKLLPAMVMALVVMTFSNVATSYGDDTSIFVRNDSGKTAHMKFSFKCTSVKKSYEDLILYHLIESDYVDIVYPINECFRDGDLNTLFSADLTIQGSSNRVDVKIFYTAYQERVIKKCEVVMEGATMSPSITRKSGPNDCRIELLYK